MAQPPRPARSDREPAHAAGRRDERLIAGAMSGTSADGVDVAIVGIAGRGLAMTARLLHHHHRPYDPALRQTLFKVRETGSTDLATLARIGRQISLAYSRAVANALSAASLASSDLECVAAHGQTLFHAPPDTIQWLDPALVAAEVGCAVVSDFRRADCAAGGQGAPLVPFADYVLFRDPRVHRVLLNLGGIANATVLAAGCRPADLIAFDTGPGNCISDYLCRKYDPAGPGHDPDGRYAARGEVLTALLDDALADPYFARPPPKSTDGPAMIELFESARRRAGYGDADLPLEDLLATACELTARTIRQALLSRIPPPDVGSTDVLRDKLTPPPQYSGETRADSAAARERAGVRGSPDRSASQPAASLARGPSPYPSRLGPGERGPEAGALAPEPGVIASSGVEVVVSGGGVLNKHLMSRLAAEWVVRVTTVADWGIPAEAKEAVAFALLGAATLDGVPSNVPSATGARRGVVLGSITPKPSSSSSST